MKKERHMKIDIREESKVSVYGLLLWGMIMYVYVYVCPVVILD